jgi:hypothetical protein
LVVGTVIPLKIQKYILIAKFHLLKFILEEIITVIDKRRKHEQG